MRQPSPPGGQGQTMHYSEWSSYKKESHLRFLFHIIGNLILKIKPASVVFCSSIIGAVAAGLRHSHSKARSLTYWARQRIEPASSWRTSRILSHWATTGTREVCCFGFICFHPGRKTGCVGGGYSGELCCGEWHFRIGVVSGCDPSSPASEPPESIGLKCKFLGVSLAAESAFTAGGPRILL